MSLSSVCVVTNALRLKSFKNNFSKECKDIDLEEQTVNIKSKEKETKIMKIVYIDGMQCNHCKMTIEKVLETINGVINVEVNLDNKNAIIESEKELDNNEIIRLIEKEGFNVIEIK